VEAWEGALREATRLFAVKGHHDTKFEEALRSFARLGCLRDEPPRKGRTS
jgi:hypothetical protein